MSSRHILTAPAWPYANGPRHIGHVSGFGLPCDMFSRYQRMAGNKVLMVSGTDEHGTPIQVQADKEGVSARELADRYNQVIGEDLHGLGMSYDLFTRTTTRNHYAVVQEIFKGLHANGYVFPKTTMGAISPSTGRTLPDRYIEGTCPICGYDGARGDQCDNCGNQLDPIDLINPKSRINGETPKFVETEHFFLDLPAFSETLGSLAAEQGGPLAAERLQVHPQPPRRHAAAPDQPRPRLGRAGAAAGLDRPARQAALRLVRRRHRLPLGAPSSGPSARATRTPGAPGGRTPTPRPTTSWARTTSSSTPRSGRRCCSATTARATRAATPGSLGALNLPTEVVSSEFLTMEGRKFSSSRQVVIYVRDFLERYDVDALRYYIAAAGPENQDTDFTWSEFVRRNNDELVAAWGNLVNRVGLLRGQEHRRDPGGRRADRRRPGDPGALAQGVRRGRRRAVPVAVQERHQRDHAHRRGGQQVPLRPGAVEAPHRRPRADEDDPARRAAARRRRQVAADAVPAELLRQGAQAARRRGRVERHAGDPRGRRGRRHPVPGAHRLATTRAARWESTPIKAGTPLAPPKPLFAKLDPSVSTRSWRGSSES